MQGYRDQHIGIRQKLGPGARHPCAHRTGQFQPVAIFQIVNKISHRPILETRDRTCALEHRRIGERLRTNQASPKILLKGCAKPLAIGPLDERHGDPTLGAERSCVHRCTAASDA